MAEYYMNGFKINPATINTITIKTGPAITE